MWRPRALAALLGLALLGLANGQGSWNCRMAKGSSHAGCGLPYQLSNFQGYFPCSSDVKVGRPKSVEELAALVAKWPKVKAVGVGGSWNEDLFCAGTDASALNLVMTEQEDTLAFINAPQTPKQVAPNCTAPSSFPIQVDETARTVTVAAGIPQRMLQDYLAEYRHCKQAAGWTLPAFTWWTDQTIGGAVATNSHGSSLKYGSLSSQVVSLTLITANGTELTVTPTSNPHLFRALGVSVGRLGVVTELTLRIRPQMAVTKSLQELSFKQFAQQVKSTQDKFVAAKAAGDEAAVKRALAELDETQALAIIQSDAVWRVDFQHLDKEPLNVLLNVPAGLQGEPMVEAMSGPAESDAAVFNQRRKAPVTPNRQMSNNPGNIWGRFYATLGREYVVPGTWEARKSFLAMTEQGTRLTSTFAPYIQFEVAVPLERAGDCLLEVEREAYGRRNLKEGFRNPALIRFISGEDFYLSSTHGGPRLWINLEDWISLSSGQPNDKFLEVVRILRDRCGARFHLGKAGLNEVVVKNEGCWDGAKEYPQTWCHFGCAVQELDPAGKFSGAGKGARNIWQWSAIRGGQAVPFASCCTAQGFSPECQCARRASCS